MIYQENSHLHIEVFVEASEAKNTAQDPQSRLTCKQVLNGTKLIYKEEHHVETCIIR